MEVKIVTKSGSFYKCLHCTYCVPSKKGIMLHLKYTHKKKNLEESSSEHACSNCGKIFTNKESIRKHIMKECKNLD